MNQIIEINNQDVTFESKTDGRILTDSLTLAKVFGKRHDNVMRDIDNLPKTEFTALNFEVSEYRDGSGKQNKLYTMTRDGLMMIAMGFTGEKAFNWKVQYINAFNELEKHYRNGTKAEPKKLNPTSKNPFHITYLPTGMVAIEDEVYIRDLDLGDFMEYKRKHSVRKLIKNLILREVISEPLVNVENYADTYYLTEQQVRSVIFHSTKNNEATLDRFAKIVDISCDLMDDEEEV